MTIHTSAEIILLELDLAEAEWCEDLELHPGGSLGRAALQDNIHRAAEHAREYLRQNALNALSTLDTLIKARALLTPAMNFTSGAPARYATGKSCHANDPLAVAWDAEGAFYAVSKPLGLHLAMCFCKLTNEWPSVYSRRHTHAEVLAVLDRLIELNQESPSCP